MALRARILLRYCFKGSYWVRPHRYTYSITLDSVVPRAERAHKQCIPTNVLRGVDHIRHVGRNPLSAKSRELQSSIRMPRC